MPLSVILFDLDNTLIDFMKFKERTADWLAKSRETRNATLSEGPILPAQWFGSTFAQNK